MPALDRFTFGMGDRFGHQAAAQLRACCKLKEAGVPITPVWNKSHREHTLIGSKPESVQAAAQQAINDLSWEGNWHVDADHINLNTVDEFLPSSDFFTIDVADFIGEPAEAEAIEKFMATHPELIGTITIDGIEAPLETTREMVRSFAEKYLRAVQEAGKVYHHIAEQKQGGDYFIEVSMDETDAPQTPVELLVILAAVSDEKIPIQTIAPKFTGRFNKGVDYVGDLEQFQKEFHEDLAVIKHCVKSYQLPSALKLSVHSGSDKFSLYPIIQKEIASSGAGLHIKTAGTTWLEEVIGLASTGGEGLQLMKDIYAEALDRYDELAGPYATVIDIDREQLPSKAVVDDWSSEEFVAALEHDQGCDQFNPHLRQLLHIGFKLAAKKGETFTNLLKDHADVVGTYVTNNLYERHMKPLFLS
ncbi:tagaturonate epimerase family protein [Calycomorphotria hydatis]|uniref:Tagaturonate/fructuronate epimerase n=1 Tax=Calycomorphotria hydatis TaxID=2528027 RepID=A0A517TAS5_9PLAN|nr:tagaturonate epimerase family protein [Calycomorphotria hydatis]QDT65478.1 hypothetical protein V22_27320 [Calycomorphotria hydatis]